MIRPDKNVSMGEYDPATGLTHITHQRGRLLFNMGASVRKQQRRGLSVSTPTPPPTSTGTFTGLSLYPEEANYLLQRGVLIIHLTPHNGNDAQRLSVAAFSTMLSKNANVSLACIEVYAFLKDRKLYPRRCVEPLIETSTGEGGRSRPQHWTAGKHCDAAYEVWKTVLVNVEPRKLAESALLKPKRQDKMLMLVFRVIVCRFGDAAPTPRMLRLAAKSSIDRDEYSLRPCEQVPVKLAVVDHDNSVVLYEISLAPTASNDNQKKPE